MRRWFCSSLVCVPSISRWMLKSLPSGLKEIVKIKNVKTHNQHTNIYIYGWQEEEGEYTNSCTSLWIPDLNVSCVTSFAYKRMSEREKLLVYIYMMTTLGNENLRALPGTEIAGLQTKLPQLSSECLSFDLYHENVLKMNCQLLICFSMTAYF